MTEDEKPRTVFPGQVIRDVKALRGMTIIGPGLRRDDQPDHMRVTRFGVLRFRAPNVYWVESRLKRYVPSKGDLVVGIVMKKAGDTITVDVGSSDAASLSMLAFEGATKKQKPDVQVGDVVYARVLNAYREMEPELVCVDSYYKAGRLGVLSSEGFVFDMGVDFSVRLLRRDCPLLRTLGRRFTFEAAVGINGKVWLNCKTRSDINKIVSILRAAEQQRDERVTSVCRTVNR